MHQGTYIRLTRPVAHYAQGDVFIVKDVHAGGINAMPLKPTERFIQYVTLYASEYELLEAMKAEMGHHVRIILLRGYEETDDEALEVAFAAARAAGETRVQVPKKITPAGTIHEGVVTELHEGFFDLQMDNGDAIGFYEDDPGILITVG